MAGMIKIEFHHMLGERGIPQSLDEPDFDQDLSNLSAWKNRSSSRIPLP
jgi:predicted HTH domain antitoxin